MAKNVGKKFEQNFKESVPEDVMFFRIPDQPQSFQQTAKFSLKPPFDSFMFYKGTLLCLELKTTKSKSFSVELDKNDKGMIHYHQLENLREYSKYDGVVAGLILNFRINEDTEKYTEFTYFISIENFDKMMKNIDKKSFNMIDLLNYSPIKIESIKKRVNFKYDIGSFLLHIKEKYSKTE